jgi:hypothetical protein
LIGSLRVSEEIEQAGIDLVGIEPQHQPKSGASQR